MKINSRAKAAMPWKKFAGTCGKVMPSDPALPAGNPASLFAVASTHTYRLRGRDSEFYIISIIISARRKLRLILSQRRTLAFALADGMLQLCHTPWHGAQWGKNESTLFEDSGAVNAVHPFVSADVSAPINGSKYFQKCHSIREDTLFALGLMLIELALEKGSEDFQIPDDIRHGVEPSVHMV
ncbi:unnamed protein product [Cercospora beticola]|nr:unnamed protein product [Cercospora beticola]